MRSKHKLGLFFSAIFLSLSLLTSCSEEFHECRNTWDACKKACPEFNEEEWAACMNACDVLHPGQPPEPIIQGPEPNEEYEAELRAYNTALDAFHECMRACERPRIIRENCLEKCDQGLRDCLGVEEE